MTRGSRPERVPRRRRRYALISGSLLVGSIALLSALIPLVAHTSPFESDFARAVTALGDPIGPSSTHILGVDRLFRDNAVRIAHATRLSFAIASGAAFLAVLFGAVIGVVAGYFQGTTPLRLRLFWLAPVAALGAAVAMGVNAGVASLAAVVLSAALKALSVRIPLLARGPSLSIDTLLMRLTDTGQSLPFMVVIMGIAAGVARMTPAIIALMLGATGWLGAARIVRGKVLVIRRETFIDAALSLGGSTPHILVRHIAPNLSTQLVILFTLLLPQMIMIESALGFLGAGLPPPTPTLGQMIYDGKDTMTAYPFILLAPATTLSALLLGLHLLGRGLLAHSRDRVE